MVNFLRYLRPLLVFAAFCLAFSGCDCSSDDIGGGADDPDAGVDAGPDSDLDDDVGPDADTETDADTGPIDDAGDTDPPNPDCPDANTCEGEGVECGWIPDGCGDTIHCGDCPGGYACGVGDEQGQCVVDDCVPDVTCEDEGVECGAIADGCGGMIDCGECGDGQICGVGPNAGQCVDADCQPLTCDEHTPGECGPYPDGCGGFVDCGACPEGHSCDSGECIEIDCQPLSCADHGDPECGAHPDGCGGFVDCGDCSGGQVCGTGSDLGTCIDYDCQPLDCSDYPDVNCGQVPDGCGGLTANCGDCTSPEICGGAGLPNVCGAEPVDDCEGLCADQAICTSSDPEDATTLTGTVYAPNGDLPIPNAVVYVPNLDDIDDLPPIEDGPVCEQCEDEDLGNPLVGTTTEFDGTFELRHVPADVEFDLVIKIGDWRRVVTVGPFAPCESHELTADESSLPTQHGVESPHDNIPQTAVSTGRIDAIECVFHQLGVDESEFSRHDEDGRIHLYRSNGGVPDQELADACDVQTGSWSWQTACGNNSCTDHDPGSCGDGSQGDLLRDNLAHHLYEDQNQLNSYDMVIMDCEGYDRTSERTNADLNRIKNYVDAGGRLFASHFAYDWLHNTDDLEDTASWGQSGMGSYTLAYVDTSWTGGSLFWDWLLLTGANYDNNHQIEVHDPRGYVSEIDHNLAERYVYTVGADHNVSYDSVQQYTFDTPVYDPSDQQCGQVAYSAFHVADVSVGGGPAFPSYCPSSMSAQEKVLAYMLFNLAACVTADGEPPDPECEPLDCTDIGAECGMASDGCGDTINCGDCPDPEICGADPDEPNQCGTVCEPLSCADHDAECGVVADGCGSTIDCGICPDGEACGVEEPNQCGCIPLECDDHGAECGTVADGCGATLDCGPCPDGQECGAGGTPNICSGDCDALTCEDHGAECGTVADGCGGTLDCGPCPEPDTCGGAGEANQCGCTPLTCDDHGAECGDVADGCGGTLDCGTCPEGVCIDLQCECLPLGETCESSDDCCSGLCGTGPDGEGQCIIG